ncbi:NAD(P)/FAD-dependent oxidoreductase [Neisseria shayeganii]|uniref:NAD(P)/FAD-dependent oxidoreductase n=1 Tax=Neisseria shayeganii TaxID=607712 RepID=A0A7D7N8V7_9NEIS|nr:NAD(P)/FAD-dependent oxidoreductase [Neisseria shayeganii]QMT39619.1 NAD(P)/FAD-dependent oxidoreductase [Neisseria shayeganii]
MHHSYDVAVIGAGPSGAVAAALLNKQGFSVCVLEKQHFPRFVIGESLLPHCLEIIEEAGFLPAVQAGLGFQYKNGAVFTFGEQCSRFEFTDKSSPGPNTAFNVQRERFDQILIEEAAKQGVTVCFGEEVTAFDNSGSHAQLSVRREDGSSYTLEAAFVLDASGYHRVLPRLLGWDIPSDLPTRQVHFTHIDDHITDPAFDRNKTWVAVHPEHRDVWLWLIPFSNGRSSVGVVGLPERFARFGSSASILKAFADEVPMFARFLADARWDNGFPFLYLPGYSASVKALYGKHFALLGNAAEFLDPVFSSGVTTAVHSAKLAADLLGKQLLGGNANWQTEFAEPLAVGVNAFRTLVEGWYDGRFQDVVFSGRSQPKVRRLINSILAGYAWDGDNPFVAQPERGLAALHKVAGKKAAAATEAAEPPPAAETKTNQFPGTAPFSFPCF